MADVKDLTGLGEPAGKLIELCRDFLRPRHIRAEARATADARIILAKADADVEEIRARAAERVNDQEIRRQLNLESIGAEAIRQLPPYVEPEPVDPDWFQDFVSQAQDVSNEEMQTLWARILVGEVAHPGSFSRRTLSAVRLLSREEANTFQKVCRLVIVLDDGEAKVAMAANTVTDEDAIWREAGVSHGDWLQLRVIGLVADEGGIGRPSVRYGRPVRIQVQGGSHRWAADADGTGSIEIGGLILSSVGAELLPVIGIELMQSYLAQVPDILRDAGFVVTPATR